MTTATIASIQANMDAKQQVINEIDSRINLLNRMIDKRRKEGLDTEPLENNIAGRLRSRAYIKSKWDKLNAQVKELRNG